MIGLCPLPWITDKAGISYWGIPEGVRSIIDLRSLVDCAKQGEYGDHPHVLMVAESLPKADGWESLCDGDPRDMRVDQKLLDTWASLTGIAVQGDTLADLIWWHLTLNADPKGLDRCKPLIPTRRNLELWSGGLLRTEPFTLADAHANKVLSVIQDGYREVFELGQQGKVAADLHQKLLDDLCDKYAVSKADRTAWEKFIPLNLRTEVEGPKKRSTVYTDNFNRANADPLGSSSEGWSWTEIGDFDISANECIIPGNFVFARAEADLSSSDHYCEHTYTGSAGGNVGNGPAVRFSNSATTCYCGFLISGLNEQRLYKVVAAAYTLLTSASASLSLPDTVRTRIAGSTLKFYLNGAETLSTTDTAISSGTRCGIAGWSVDTSVDDWMCDDEVAGGLDIAIAAYHYNHHLSSMC